MFVLTLSNFLATMSTRPDLQMMQSQKQKTMNANLEENKLWNPLENKNQSLCSIEA